MLDVFYRFATCREYSSQKKWLGNCLSFKMNKSTLYFCLSQYLFSEATTLLTCKCHIQTGFKTNLLKCLKVLKKNIKRIEDIQDAVMNLQGIIIRYNIQKKYYL